MQMFFERLIKAFSVLIVVFLFGYGAYLSFSIFIWKDVYKPLPTENKTIKLVNLNTGKNEEITYKNNLKAGDPFAFLLLGTDSDSIESGRTDTIIIGIAEPKTNTLNLISVPRDSWILNQATGKKDKITHAFNHGVSNTIKTIEDYFQIPVTYYALINMNGFIDTINAIGGLNINVEKEIQFDDRITHKFITLYPGEQHLDGNQAINYSRFRDDGEGDFGRNRRQRQVITELIKQTTQFQNINKINELMGILKNDFRTNVSINSIPLLLEELDLGHNLKINQIEVKGTPGWANGMSVVNVSESERLQISAQLQQKLKLRNQ